MKRNLLIRALSVATLIFCISDSSAEDLKGDVWLYTQTSQSQQSMTANKGLKLLKEGNKRFTSGQSKNRNLLQQAKLTTKKGQYPFAIILSCMDSRGSPELIFDQGIGDIFSVRLAGNVLDADQLAGLEYATKVVGSHLIVVMGHTRCGAVAGSCSGVELGNLTQLLQKIQPAVDQVKKANNISTLNCQDTKIIDDIAKQNVKNVIHEVTEESSTINNLVNSGAVMIVGAMQDLKTGEVTFFN